MSARPGRHKESVLSYRIHVSSSGTGGALSSAEGIASAKLHAAENQGKNPPCAGLKERRNRQNSGIVCLYEYCSAQREIPDSLACGRRAERRH